MERFLVVGKSARAWAVFFYNSSLEVTLLGAHLSEGGWCATLFSVLEGISFRSNEELPPAHSTTGYRFCFWIYKTSVRVWGRLWKAWWSCHSHTLIGAFPWTIRYRSCHNLPHSPHATCGHSIRLTPCMRNANVNLPPSHKVVRTSSMCRRTAQHITLRHGTYLHHAWCLCSTLLT